MLRVNTLRVYRQPFCRTLFSYSGAQQNTVVVDTDGTQREIIYTGPVNNLVNKTKVSSLVSAGASIVAAPLVIRYLGSDAWSLASNIFFCSGVGAASAAQLWATSGILGRYVVHAYKLKSTLVSEEDVPFESQLIEIETIDWMGRTRRRALFIRDLYVSGPGELSSRSSGEKFAFCPHISKNSPILSQIMIKK